MRGQKNTKNWGEADFPTELQESSLWWSKFSIQYTERSASFQTNLPQRWFPGRMKKVARSFSASKWGYLRGPCLWYIEDAWKGKKTPPSLMGWDKVTSTPLLYLYVIYRPMAYSQRLLWGFVKFLPRSTTCQWHLSSQVSVWCWCTRTCPHLQAGIPIVPDCFLAPLLISGTWPGFQPALA